MPRPYLMMGVCDGIGSMRQSSGFTLVELVMVLVIAGILSATALPKFSDNSVFQSRGFADQVLATLRYAQKTAIAQHQNVCVNLAVTTVTLTIDNAACSTNLNLPDRPTNSLTAPTDITLTTTAATLTFDANGRPSTAATITIPEVSTAITVEAETGYVHQ